MTMLVGVDVEVVTVIVIVAVAVTAVAAADFGSEQNVFFLVKPVAQVMNNDLALEV